MNTDLSKLLNLSSTGQASTVPTSEGLNIESLLSGEAKSEPSEIDELIKELLENIDGAGEGDMSALTALLGDNQPPMEGEELVKFENETAKLSTQLKNMLAELDGKIGLDGNIEKMSPEEKELVLQKVKEAFAEKNLTEQNVKVQVKPTQLKLIDGGNKVGHTDLFVNKNKILNSSKVNQDVPYFEASNTPQGLHAQLVPHVAPENAKMDLNLKHQVSGNLNLDGDSSKAQLIDKITGHIAKMNVTGKENFEFRVDHKELGQIDINVQKINGNDINLKIQTANPEAYQILSENKGDLLSHLKSTGIRVFDFSLDMGQTKISTSSSSQGQFDSQYSGKDQGNNGRNSSQQHPQGDNGRQTRDDLWDLLREGRAA